MPAATFTGTSERIYTQYLDADPVPAGTTLVAEPQGTYEIAIADDWDVAPIPGDGLWGGIVPLPLAGFNAIPGLTVVGQSPPGYPGTPADAGDMAVLDASLGDPLAVTAPVAATFLGTSARIYTQYLDADPAADGTTLVAEPQNTYQISIADGWQVGSLPGDGLWGAVPRGVLSFTITPGFGVPGGASPGQPGFTDEPELMEAVFTEPAAHSRTLMPAARVVRGHARRLHPAPARRTRKLARRRGVRL